MPINLDLLESVIDWTRSTLDPKIFNKIDNKYQMKDDVIKFIKDIITGIHNNVVTINNYFIKGSILSFQWLDNTDIDLLLEIDKNIDEEEWKNLQDIVDESYNILIPNTEHPLQIYLQRGKYNIDNADGIYYLDHGWIKGPYNISINIDDYISKFHKTVASIDTSTGELKRDLIDYELLNKFDSDEIKNLDDKINDKIKEIDNDVEDLVLQYKHIRDLRHKAFDDNMTPKEISKYGVKNNLPDNVIWKLLERYYYIKFLRSLKEFYENDDINSKNDINYLRSIMNMRG